MSAPKDRRHWSAEKKLRIVLESLQSDRKVAEICRRERLTTRRRASLGRTSASRPWLDIRVPGTCPC